MFQIIAGATIKSMLVLLLVVANGMVVNAQQDASLLDSLSKDEAFKRLQELIVESRMIHRTEYNPIRKDVTSVTQPLHEKVSMESQYRSRLKNVNDDSLQRVRQEIRDLNRRVEMLERVESVLSDMDPGAVQKAVDESEIAQKEITAQITDVAKPLHAEMSELHREHRGKNKLIVELMPLLFNSREGTDYEGLEQKHTHANCVVGTFATRFVKKDESEGFNVELRFEDKWNRPNTNSGKFDEKFTVISKSSNSIAIDVSGIHVRFFAIGKSSPDDVAKGLRALIDLDMISKIGSSQ